MPRINDIQGLPPIKPEGEKKPEPGLYDHSIGLGVVSDKHRNLLEQTFGLPFRFIAAAADLAQSTGITIAQAVGLIKKNEGIKDDPTIEGGSEPESGR